MVLLNITNCVCYITKQFLLYKGSCQIFVMFTGNGWNVNQNILLPDTGESLKKSYVRLCTRPTRKMLNIITGSVQLYPQMRQMAILHRKPM